MKSFNSLKENGRVSTPQPDFEYCTKIEANAFEGGGHRLPIGKKLSNQYVPITPTGSPRPYLSDFGSPFGDGIFGPLKSQPTAQYSRLSPFDNSWSFGYSPNVGNKTSVPKSSIGAFHEKPSSMVGTEASNFQTSGFSPIIESPKSRSNEKSLDPTAVACTLNFLGLDDDIGDGSGCFNDVKKSGKPENNFIINEPQVQSPKQNNSSVSVLLGNFVKESAEKDDIVVENRKRQDSFEKKYRFKKGESNNFGDPSPNLMGESETSENQTSQISGDRKDHKKGEFNIDSLSPTRSLWIGNVDPSLTEADLYVIFSPYGEIDSIRILPDKECAFVNFVNISDASAAKSKMQGGRVGNCIIKVGFGKSEPTVAQAATAAPVEPVVSWTTSPSRALWIGNLSPNVPTSVLLSLFEAFGPIDSYRVLPHKNCGFVNFVHTDDSIAAKKELNGKIMEGIPIKIGFAKAPVDRNSDDTNNNNSGGVKNDSNNSISSSPRATVDNFENSRDILLDSQDNHFETVIPVLRHTVSDESGGKTFKHDSNSLRDMRKKLDSASLSVREFEHVFNSVLPYAVELSTDAFGNTIIQKLIEKSSDQQRQTLIEKCSQELAAIGIHKNGTWVVQKMVDFAKTHNQINAILSSLKPYTPALLLDPFGNYVIQGCLRLGSSKNQFIFDAMYTKCREIAFGKFGARSMRACLENSYCTISQQQLMANAIVCHSMALITNPNGILLLHWLLDNNELQERYRVICGKLLPKIAYLSNQKLSHVIILKLLIQKAEPEVRTIIMDEIFKNEASLVATFLGGSTAMDEMKSAVPFEFGCSIILKCLQLMINEDEIQRKKYATQIKDVISRHFNRQSYASRAPFFKKLVDEVEEILSDEE